MKTNNDGSSNFLSSVISTLLKVDTWHKVGMLIILTTWLALVYDFIANKAQNSRELFTTFAGASRRPVLFAEDYKFINALLKKYPKANISVIEVKYLAGIEGLPLTDLNKTDRVILNKSGVPIAAILISPTSPPEAKAEIQRYFKGNDNISPQVPLDDNPDTPKPSPLR